jgi:hypothetical protein
MNPDLPDRLPTSPKPFVTDEFTLRILAWVRLPLEHARIAMLAGVFTATRAALLLQVVILTFFWNGLFFLERVIRSDERHKASASSPPPKASGAPEWTATLIVAAVAGH